MYNVILKLSTGEYKTLSNIACISWTRARVIFSQAQGESYTFYSKNIEHCELDLIKGGERVGIFSKII